MLMRIEQNQRIALAHWTYNREEWKSFIRWDKLRRGRLWYVVYYFLGKKETTIPEITITNKKIWIGNAVESFNDINKQIKRITINDMGDLNILEITYSILKNGISKSEEIRVPVPKGKLKEAIQVQESILDYSALG